MRKALKKLIICILIILMIFNFMSSNICPVYADTSDSDTLNLATEEKIATLVAGVSDGFAGIYTWFMRAGAVVVSTFFQIGTYYVLISGGTSSSFSSSIYLTPYDIFFNNFALTNINIFQTNDVKANSFVANMRNNFSACFLIFETLALILLVIKFFVGIAKQFIINTTADDKKIGADLAADSAVSFILVLLMDTIILAIILLNETLLDAISQIGKDVSFEELLNGVRVAALSLSYTLGMAGTIAIVLLTFYTMKFAVSYILRFITVAVLIMIAPFMPVFFSASKARSGAPSALNRWFRIFVSNVFIQSIHALIYTAVIIFPFAAINTVFGSLGDLMEAFLLIIGLIFIKQIEKFIVTLFGIDEDVASLTMINREIHNVVNTATKVATAGASVVTAGGDVIQAVRNGLGFGQNLDNNTETEDNNVTIHEPSRFRNMLNTAGTAVNGTAGIIGSVASLDYATDHPNGKSFEEDDMKRRNRDRAREEREAYEAKMSGEKPKEENQDGNNQEQIEDKNEVELLPAGQEENETDAEEVAEQALKDAVDSSNQEETESEEIHEEMEVNQEIEETEVIEIELTPEQAEERTDIQDKYNELLDDIKAAKDLQNELKSAMEEMQEKFGDEKSSEIKLKMDDIYKNQGFEGAKDYAMSLGDGEEGDFAKMYLVYLDNTNALNEMIASDDTDGGILDLVDKGIDDGAITAEEGEKLLNNAINVADGKENESGKIFGQIKLKESQNGKIPTKESTDVEETPATSEDTTTTQVVEKETENKEEVAKPQLELSAIADIPTPILNKALKSSVVKSAIKVSNENIKAVQGGITTNGSITGESLARIVNDMENGAYSEENYKKVRGAAISAGESDNIERFDKNPTPANAAACGGTEEGRNYVKNVSERSVGTALLTTSTLINTPNNQTTTNNPNSSAGVNETVESLKNQKPNS